MSAQTFEDIRKLVENYRLDILAQSISPEQEIRIETEDEEINHIIEDFLGMVDEFLKRKDRYSSREGTLEWLDWIYRTLSLESKIIVAMGEKSYARYEQEKRWFIEFAVNAMIELIQRVQKWIRKEAGLFKNTKRDYSSLRQSVICELANLTFALFSIVFAIIRIEKDEMKPQELYEVVADSLHTLHRIRM